MLHGHCAVQALTLQDSLLLIKAIALGFEWDVGWEGSYALSQTEYKRCPSSSWPGAAETRAAPDSPFPIIYRALTVKFQGGPWEAEI